MHRAGRKPCSTAWIRARRLWSARASAALAGSNKAAKAVLSGSARGSAVRQLPGISWWFAARSRGRAKARNKPRCGAGTGVLWAWIAIVETPSFVVVRAVMEALTLPSGPFLC